MNSAVAAAKVNLTLHITGRRETLHTLDMRVCSVSLFDRVTLLPPASAPEGIADGSGRTVLTAMPEGFRPELFFEAFSRTLSLAEEFFGKTEGVFAIEKRIPARAGLGGSSAPAAALVRLLSARSGIRPTSEFLLSLGSDVPYMYEGGEARVTGCGESVERLPFGKRSVLLVLPSGGSDTAKAYALYDEGVISPGDNHLFAAACRLCPETGRAAEALSLAGARRVVMSGSGSAVCAFFGDEQEAERVKRALPRDLDCVLLHTVDGLGLGSVDL